MAVPFGESADCCGLGDEGRDMESLPERCMKGEKGSLEVKEEGNCWFVGSLLATEAPVKPEMPEEEKNKENGEERGSLVVRPQLGRGVDWSLLVRPLPLPPAGRVAGKPPKPKPKPLPLEVGLGNSSKEPSGLLRRYKDSEDEDGVPLF